MWMHMMLLGATLVGTAPPAPDPSVLTYVLRGKIEWHGGENGGPQYHILSGDPSKPGPYALLARWLPNRMSRPHTHPHDRIITVISGTWWLGSGKTYAPETTTPVPAGTVVTHFAGRYHYDGAKDEPTVIEIVGEGPQ
jgi:hypothetical protein